MLCLCYAFSGTGVPDLKQVICYAFSVMLCLFRGVCLSIYPSIGVCDCVCVCACVCVCVYARVFVSVCVSVCLSTVSSRFKNTVPPEGSLLKGPYTAYGQKLILVNTLICLKLSNLKCCTSLINIRSRVTTKS